MGDLAADVRTAPHHEEPAEVPSTARPRRVPWPPVVLAAVAAMGAAFVNRILFPYYSGDADEPVYRFQALMLLDGHLTLSAADQEPFFRPWLSGPYGDRLMLAFTWPWPAFLALSQFLTGSMLPAVCLASAGATLAFWLFADELLGERRHTNLATVLFTFCPFVWMLGGTYLNYVFALGLHLTFGWMLLRGLRTRSQPWLIGAGTVWALAFYTRPYDGVLVAIPLGLYVLFTHRDRLGDLVRPTVLLALGAVPVLAVILAANVATSGSPTTFPTTHQSGGAARFFFGERNITKTGGHPVDYTFSRSMNALRRNLVALPGWLVGSWLALVPAVYGSIRLWRRQRPKLALLLGLTAVWPVMYVFWFASALTANGARHGLGPHYYVPMTVPLAILAAVGLSALWDERRQVLLVGIAVAAVISFPELRPKIEHKVDASAGHEDYRAQVLRQVQALDGRPAIVVLEHNIYPVIMGEHAYLANKPDLSGPVLYAADVGPELADIFERYPDRRVFKIQPQRTLVGNDISEPRIVLEPLELVSGDRVTVHATITNTSGKPHVDAFVRSGRKTVRVVLDTQSERGRTYEVTWTARADDGKVEVTGEGEGDGEPVTGQIAASGELAVGASFSQEANTRDPSRVELRYDYRATSDGTIDLLTAAEDWSRIGAPFSTWLKIKVDDQIDVTAEGS